MNTAKRYTGCAGLVAAGFVLFLYAAHAQAQAPYLSSLSATKESPLFTTYAAPESNSEFMLDKGYHLQLNDGARGADLTNETGGDICMAFSGDGRFVYALKDMFREPVISASYSDCVTYSFWPFDSIRVDVAFAVQSSHHALQRIEVTNVGSRTRQVVIYSFLRNRGSRYEGIRFTQPLSALTFTHTEKPDDWVLAHGVPYAGKVGDTFVLSVAPDRVFSIRDSLPGGGFLNPGTKRKTPGHLNTNVLTDTAHVVAFSVPMNLRPGLAHSLCVVRSVSHRTDGAESLIDTSRGLFALDIRKCIERDEQLYGSIPPPPSPDGDIQMLYWSAFSLMRQVMLPPEGKCHFNYYVFSREPQWGWGHGGQVFHESLTMLSYAMMDPVGAMGSQRVYMERQAPGGYINYRTGPYLDEEIPYDGVRTTSAPWYAWENWEIYRVTRDRKFLEDAYASSGSFYRWYCAARDSDGDGLCEWGGHAVLESVRDGEVAVWDQVGWPARFESVDLNAMLVSEAKSLTAMAMILGRTSEAEAWEKDVQARCTKINALMWDSASVFYFNIDRKTHSFTSKTPGDLKREEITGFLPLWAGVARKDQAERLVAKLKDTSKFWRRYGVPSLAADDPYYSPKGYWNGPVWVQWNYLIVRGLLQYGYVREARELTMNVASAMVAQLKKDHNFWEFYSPDDAWAGYHRTYIWAGIINRMLIDVARAPGN